MGVLADGVVRPATVTFGGAVVATAVYLVVAGLVWPHRDRPGAEPLLGILLGATTWTVAETGTVVATDPGTVLFFERLINAGTTIVVLSWILFALEYTGRGRWLTPRTAGLLAVEPVAFNAVAWSGGLFGLVWTETEWIASVTNYAATGYGPVFWVHLAYSYGLLVVGAYLLVDASLSTERQYSGRTVAMLAGVFVPMVSSIGYVFGFHLFPGVDQTAYLMVVSAAAFGWVVTDRGLLEVVPVAPAVDHAGVIERMGEGLVVVDAENRVVECNTAATEFSVVDPEGRPVAEAFPGLEPVLEVDPGEGRQVTLDSPDGRERYVRASVGPVREDGDDLGRVITLHDVTDRVVRDQRIEVLNRVLRHNVRQEATLILGHLELMEDHLDDGHVHAGIVKEAARSIESYSDQARSIERILADANTGRSELDLVEVVEDAVETVQSSHDAGTVTVDVPATAPALVHVSIRQAVLELVENAVVHNDDPTVRVTVAVADDAVEVRIADDGTGIPENERVVVDEGTETPLNHASGLGLWLVNWVVEASGGELRLGESDHGGGLAVISVPRAPTETDPVGGSPEPDPVEEVPE